MSAAAAGPMNGLVAAAVAGAGAGAAGQGAELEMSASDAREGERPRCREAAAGASAGPLVSELSQSSGRGGASLDAAPLCGKRDE